MNKKTLFFLIILLSFQSLRTYCTNYYVNDNSTTGDTYCTAVGNDANSGLTKALPKLTLKTIPVFDLNAGDTVFIDAGTYTSANDYFILGADDQGSAAGYIVFKGASISKTIIGRTSSTNPRCFDLSSNIYIKIQDLTLQSSSSGAENIRTSGNSDYIYIYTIVILQAQLLQMALVLIWQIPPIIVK
ncbi:MAG: hypothetical protein WCK02_04000 [Bacteroidota bacterium]